jgi:hypothetical protein
MRYWDIGAVIDDGRQLASGARPGWDPRSLPGGPLLPAAAVPAAGRDPLKTTDDLRGVLIGEDRVDAVAIPPAARQVGDGDAASDPGAPAAPASP